MRFTLLNLEEIVLTRIGYMAQFVQFSIHTIANHPTLCHQLWWVVLYFAFYSVTNRLTEVQLLPYPFQRFVIGIQTRSLDRLDSLQGHLQLYNLTRRHPAHSNLRNDTLQVAYTMQLVIDTLAELWFAIVVLHDIQTFVDGLFIFKREYQPTTQHTTTHRRHCAINHVKQRLTIVLHRRQ